MVFDEVKTAVSGPQALMSISLTKASGLLMPIFALKSLIKCPDLKIAALFLINTFLFE